MLAAGRCGCAVSLPQGPASRPCLRCTARTVAAGTHHTFHENIVSDGGTTAGYTNAPLFAITPVVDTGCSQVLRATATHPVLSTRPQRPWLLVRRARGGACSLARSSGPCCVQRDVLASREPNSSRHPPNTEGGAPWPRPSSEGSWTRVDTGSHTPREQGQSGGISDCGQRPEGPVKGPRAQLPQHGAALAPRLHAQMQTGISRRP